MDNGIFKFSHLADAFIQIRTTEAIKTTKEQYNANAVTQLA